MNTKKNRNTSSLQAVRNITVFGFCAGNGKEGKAQSEYFAPFAPFAECPKCTLG